MAAYGCYLEPEVTVLYENAGIERGVVSQQIQHEGKQAKTGTGWAGWPPRDLSKRLPLGSDDHETSRSFLSANPA